MQPWEITLKRAYETLAIWKLHAPGAKVRGEGHEVLEALIDQFEPMAQACVTSQDEVDAATRAAQDTLAKLKLLGTRVPQIIEAQLDDNEPLMTGLRVIYRTSPRTEATILTRMRELYPFWLLADEAMAAQTPPQPPITRRIQGLPHSAAMAKALLDGYNNEVQEVGKMNKQHAVTLAAQAALDQRVDSLNKRWYKMVSNSFEAGSAEHEALDKIPTEQGALVPTVLEIKSVKQAGEAGRQVIVRYAAKGGERATRRWLKWQVLGVDADYVNELPLDPKGNTLGPFEVGTELRIIAEVANSAASRTSAPRSITITAPVG